MAYIQQINLNVQALPQVDDPTTLRLAKDENGRQLRFHILGIEIPDGSQATFTGTKPDGTVYTTQGTITGDYVTINEDYDMTDTPGKWDAKIRIINGANVIATNRITITVDPDTAPWEAPEE